MFNNGFGGPYMGAPYYGGFGQPGSGFGSFDGYPYDAPPRMNMDNTVDKLNSRYKKLLSSDYFVINCLTNDEISGEDTNIGYFCINRFTNKCYISSIFTIDALHHYSNLSDKMILFKKFINKYNSDETNSKITSSTIVMVHMRAEGKSIPFFDSKPLIPNESDFANLGTSIDDLNKED